MTAHLVRFFSIVIGVSLVLGVVVMAAWQASEHYGESAALAVVLALIIAVWLMLMLYTLWIITE